MSFTSRRLLRIELTVADLPRAEKFYIDGLDFVRVHAGSPGSATAALLGADHIATVELRRGNQTLVLQSFDPLGMPYPQDATSCDQIFQHFAVPTTDIAVSHARLQQLHAPQISSGPQHLPARSGGVTAFKFRDPDGHPLELIQFPDGHAGGIDHSAIVVMDAERSIAFYRDQLGFSLASRQINIGAEQDRLDGLAAVSVEVVALQPHDPAPHLELLAYRHPLVKPSPKLRPDDIAATRLVLEVDDLPESAPRLADGRRGMLIHDPDHHALLLLAKS